MLIVGGGATGAATARDAALRGLDVALVDAGDFAGETSSQSSKLIHGGLRYLQYGDLHLVFEGLAERRNLMRTAPHLCRPVEFLFPAYRGERPTLATLGTGIRLYNALALWKPPAGSRTLRPGQLYELAPQLRSAGLEGAQSYVDCQTDDARLVLEHVLDAEAAGATVANHVRATGPPARRLTAVFAAPRSLDGETGARLEARATVVISATGPFTDSFAREQRRATPAPDAGRAPGVRRRARAAQRTRAGAALAARQPPVLRVARRPAHDRGHDRHRLAVAGAAAPGQRHPRARRRRRLPAGGDEPLHAAAAARGRRRVVHLRGAAAAARDRGRHAVADLARARHRAAAATA